jgi:hypothetical protein
MRGGVRPVRATGLTNHWSGRVTYKVPSPYTGVRDAQLNR